MFEAYITVRFCSIAPRVVCFCFDSREIFRLDLPAASVIWVFRNGEFSSSGLERRTLKKY